MHHIVEIPLFTIMFWFILVVLLFSAYRSSRRERAARELPRHQLRRLRAAAGMIQSQVSLMHIVPIFLYLAIGMHASIFIRSVGNPSVRSFLILSLLPGFG
jgi:hypothetical protein